MIKFTVLASLLLGFILQKPQQLPYLIPASNLSTTVWQTGNWNSCLYCHTNYHFAWECKLRGVGNDEVHVMLLSGNNTDFSLAIFQKVGSRLFLQTMVSNEEKSQTQFYELDAEARDGVINYDVLPKRFNLFMTYRKTLQTSPSVTLNRYFAN